MKTVLYTVVLATLAFGWTATFVAWAEGEDACDMKTVVKGFYCSSCEETLLAKNLVSEVVYYLCTGCDEVSDEPGTCEDCEVELVKKVSGKGVCAGCLEKPAAAEICEKIYFLCPDCDMTAARPGQCAECEVALEKQTDLAVIHYVCPHCDMTSLKPGKCTDDSCEHHGKALKKECSCSGDYPHGGAE